MFENNLPAQDPHGSAFVPAQDVEVLEDENFSYQGCFTDISITDHSKKQPTPQKE